MKRTNNLSPLQQSQLKILKQDLKSKAIKALRSGEHQREVFSTIQNHLITFLLHNDVKGLSLSRESREILDAAVLEIRSTQ